MTEKKFIRGLWFNLPNNNAPDFVKGSISLSKVSFQEWLDNEEPNEKGYIKIDLKVSQAGKPYAEVNDYKPNTAQGYIPEEEKESTSSAEDEYAKMVDEF